MLGDLPRFDPLTPERLSAWTASEFDRDRRAGGDAALTFIDRDRAVRVASVHADANGAGAAANRPRRGRLSLHGGRTQLLDGISSWWVNIHGHSHPRLNRGARGRRRESSNTSSSQAARMRRPSISQSASSAVLPAGLARVFYSDNGSTAVEVAMKMALQYWRNRGQPRARRFVALHHAYHGDTVGAMSVSAPSVFTEAFAPLLFAVDRVHARLDVDSHLQQHGERVAAVLVEPMLQGAGGMIVWPAEFARPGAAACAPQRHADDCRRSAHRIRPDRADVRVRARRRSRRTSSVCRRR